MKKLFLAFSLIWLLGCGKEKEEAPADLLPQGKLTSILADIHIAESRVEMMRISPDSAQVVFKRLQKEILNKHKVTDSQFLKTYTYYLNHVQALDKMYEGLVDSLGMREINMETKSGNRKDRPAKPIKPSQPEILP